MYDTTESRSIAQTMALLLRHWWVLVACAAVGAGLGFARSAISESGAVASGAIGLSDEVSWPYHEQIRNSYVAVGNDEAVRDAVWAEQPGLNQIEVMASDTDVTQIFIRAEAPDEATALAAVTLMSDLVIQDSLETVATQNQLDRELLQADLDELGAEFAELNNQHADVAAREAASQENVNAGGPDFESNLADLRVAQQDRSTLNIQIDDTVRRQATLQSQIDDVDRRIAGGAGDLVPVLEADSELLATTAPLVSVVLGMLVGLVLAVLAVVALFGGRERVSTSLLRSALPGVVVAAGSGDGEPLPFQADRWSNLLTDGESTGVLRTAAADLSDSDWERNEDADWDNAAVIGTSEATGVVERSKDLVVLVSRKDRLDHVRALCDSAGALDVPVRAIVVVDA